ncbi:hypothetical protein PHYBLDRAFT_163564 [Phycomyces blakesleeanus NRRL 1555(-)]|uniref:Uncharacterized protein n=1 Tax=Phycomyces blakesleeanus (strain ATCC 8743b / DSM 1359 / FGSC 10004 / NBRC 33097 / NRRL 1555) TaxID=763407 RepID=A0A167PSF4_PHYB8|nr:hypothetical protein PHYBLDRAFT_174774 [Phycomyces blakesleeanus NRRL 1555(-)]XP_018296497.1 hypothetical protein PHYBLDRAFT_163564 [Phycomyces blakesleeanus NRRL 1555(-)]OAD67066.1 hypothetical protein PHYBLDRAFT_174774 [Phycomyces blakesleeanus NRRL 1555(-)]OAD78457.1 hypothetical protein PHYBLDRAFT_163564 [Phycomyces blakesleeanus NRRL 1555(-)]|eukprot:XP_018285106.1 hypothetical protein PHYBLDRAFT_174774 [Phycomyces blakesleeanus NRRL 1555(-)]
MYNILLDSFQTMVNNRQSIAPAPSPEYTELLRRLTAMEESLKTMDSNIGIVIKGNKDSLEILDSVADASGELLAVIAPTTIPASASVPFAASSVGSTLDWYTTPSEALFGISSAAPSVAPSVGPSVAPSVGPVVLTGANAGELSKQDRTRVLALIRGELKKHNFKSNKPELVAANDSKRSWDVNVDYRLPPNRQLMHDLHAYLAPKVVGTSVRQADISDCIYTNFCGTRRRVKESYEARKKTNSRSRKAGRETDHFDRRELTYHTFKAEIDMKVGKSCDGLLQKEAMSEGESEDDMPGVSSNRAIRTVRPSWRSDEYNHFLAVVDDFMRNRMDFNSRQMLKRSFGRDAVLAVPPRLTSLLPHWAFRDEFQ